MPNSNNLNIIFLRTILINCFISVIMCYGLPRNMVNRIDENGVEVNLMANSNSETIETQANSTILGTSGQEMNDKDDPEFAEPQKENQEDEGDGNENMITGLISAFLGGLSKPDGSIDIDAIVGLLGSLSTQNADGSYDFQGLTDLLRGLFGGDGGSDVGAFVGGLLGAVVKGVANPPGAKGAGILTGKIFNGILPALSVSPDNDMTGYKNQDAPSLDVGGFILGLLKTIFSGSSGSMNQGMGNKKFTFIKTILSAIASIFTASSKKMDPQ